jgi:hypothetical protein
MMSDDPLLDKYGLKPEDVMVCFLERAIGAHPTVLYFLSEATYCPESPSMFDGSLSNDFDRTSKLLEKMLYDALPGGTYDRLLARMQQRKASHYAFSYGLHGNGAGKWERKVIAEVVGLFEIQRESEWGKDKEVYSAVKNADDAIHLLDESVIHSAFASIDNVRQFVLLFFKNWSEDDGETMQERCYAAVNKANQKMTGKEV